MSNCDAALSQGIEKTNAAFDPLINENLRVIANMKGKGLDPTKYYDAAHDQVIDLLALTADFAAQRDSQIAEIRKEVEQKCDGTTQFIQSIVDLAVARYTKDLSIILPRHMTHIDVNEILKGHLLGGPNSVFNEVKNSVYGAMGMGENNDLRKTIDHPVDTAKDAVNNVLSQLGLPFRL